MMEDTYKIIKTYFLNYKHNSIAFFFHPDNENGIAEIIFEEDGDVEDDLYLPDLAALMDQKKLDTYDESRYDLFKNHIQAVVDMLQNENFLFQENFIIYCIHVDGEPEVIFYKENSQSQLFPPLQKYSFNLSMVKHKDERKWWKITQPMDQEQNGVRYFELTKESRKYEDFNSWEGESLNKCDIRNLELLSDYKIGKLEDYAKSDLYEVFSDRFCQMLNQIGVNNIEYYPLTVTCNGRKESSSTYYKLANIVGRVKDICFYDAKRGIDCSSTEDLKSRILKNRIYAITKNREKIISPSILQSKKEALEIIEEKILRYDQERMRVPYLIVDNDIKEACEANSITGISFDEEVILTMLPVN